MKIIAIDNSLGEVVRFGEHTLKFTGRLAEVEDEVGALLVAKYSTMLVDAENYNPTSKEPPKKKNNKTLEEERLEKLLEASDAELKRTKKERDDAVNGEKFWKELYDKVKAENDGFKKGLKIEQKTENNEPEQDTSDFETEIRSTHPAKLKKICRDMEYPESEWGELRTKDELAEYVIGKNNQ